MYGRFGKGGGTGIKPEKKFHDTILAATTISGTGTTMQNGTTDMIELVRGTGENERNGSRIRIKSIHGRIRLMLPHEDGVTTGAASFDQVRIMVGIDKQANGAAATMAQILEESVAINQFRNIENVHRFVMLYDRSFTFNATGFTGMTTTTIDTPAVMKFIAINLQVNIPIYYDGALGAVSEIRSHNIFAFAISLNGRPTMICHWRIRYYG